MWSTTTSWGASAAPPSSCSTASNRPASTRRRRARPLYTSLKGDGFDTGAAFTEVIGTWDKQVKTLLQACAHISNHLDYTKASRKKDDEWIETQLRIIGPVAPDKDGAVPASQINKYFR